MADENTDDAAAAPVNDSPTGAKGGKRNTMDMKLGLAPLEVRKQLRARDAEFNAAAGNGINHAEYLQEVREAEANGDRGTPAAGGWGAPPVDPEGSGGTVSGEGVGEQAGTPAATPAAKPAGKRRANS